MKRHLVALFAGALISSPLCALEVQGNVILLDADDMKACVDGGGCGVVTVKAMSEAMTMKYHDGLVACRLSGT